MAAIEEIGTFGGVKFEVSTSLAPGSFVFDERLPQPLKPDMSSMDFRIMLSEHSAKRVVFSWDVRARAREIFFVLAEGFDSFMSTQRPREAGV